VKFQEKYRTESHRLTGWDYSQDGFYFITICTQNRENIFGEIRNGKMQLSEIGKIVEEEWQRTEKIRRNVKLDAFVVMLNHLHGIVIIDNVLESKNVETHCNAFLQKQNSGQNYKNKFGPQSNNLSAIIRGFKSAVTKRIHQIQPALDRVWQPRFHDRIIRDEDELNRVRDYIWQNPENWGKDEENQERF